MRVAVIGMFNEAFATDIPTTEADYIDIYKAKRAEKFFNKLANCPIPMCKYCNMRGRENQYPWARVAG